MKPQKFPRYELEAQERLTVQVHDEVDSAQELALFVRNNRRFYKLNADRLARKTGLKPEWFTKPAMIRRIPNVEQLQRLAKEVKLQITLEFGNAKIAGHLMKPVPNSMFATIHTILLERREGAISIQYVDKQQMIGAIKACISHVLEVRDCEGASTKYALYAKEIDAVGRNWYKKIHKICDDLDLTIRIDF